MLGNFANIKTLMKLHRSEAFHISFYSGDMVRAIKTQTCPFKVMMDKLYEAYFFGFVALRPKSQLRSWRDRAGIEFATPGSAVRLASVAGHVTDCALRPGTL